MADFNAGDIITFRLRGDRYGVATILLARGLAFHSNYHLAVHDAVIEGSKGGFDALGEPSERGHDPADIDTSATVLDHLGVTRQGLDESEPMLVGRREIVGEEMDGYRLWLAAARRAAAERGMIGRAGDASVDDAKAATPADESPVDEPGTDEAGGVPEVDEMPDGWEDEIAGEGSDTEEIDDETGDEGAMDELSDEELLATAELRPWHTRIFDRSIGAALFEMHEAMAAEPVIATTLGSYIASFYDGSKTEEIRGLIDSLVDGDYGAGQELLGFGDAAAGLLGERLNDLREPEVVADVLQILADMGTDTAYEALAEYFAAHDDVDHDPLAIPAARAFAYAVMLTGASPEPLVRELERLTRVDHPEVNDDIASAMKAVVELDPTKATTAPEQKSSDPFGTLAI